MSEIILTFDRNPPFQFQMLCDVAVEPARYNKPFGPGGRSLCSRKAHLKIWPAEPSALDLLREGAFRRAAIAWGHRPVHLDEVQVQIRLDGSLQVAGIPSDEISRNWLEHLAKRSRLDF